MGVLVRLQFCKVLGKYNIQILLNFHRVVYLEVLKVYKCLNLDGIKYMFESENIVS